MASGLGECRVGRMALSKWILTVAVAMVFVSLACLTAARALCFFGTSDDGLHCVPAVFTTVLAGRWRPWALSAHGPPGGTFGPIGTPRRERRHILHHDPATSACDRWPKTDRV